MAARPTPPRTDVEVTRALNAASRGHARWRRTEGRIIDWYGVSVYYAKPNQPYGRSTQARGYLTHLVAHGYLAWRSGRLAGQMIRWRCGGSTQHFVLLGEPNSPLCPVCVALAFGRGNLTISAAATP
jgi:hypothetical protein